MKSLLYITNQDPNGVGGGCFASHAYLKVFSKIFEGNVTLCIADNCKSQDPDRLSRLMLLVSRNVSLIWNRLSFRWFLSSSVQEMVISCWPLSGLCISFIAI